MVFEYSIIKQEHPIIHLSPSFRIGEKFCRGYIFLDYMLYIKDLKVATGFYHDNDPRIFFHMLFKWIDIFNEGCKKGWFFGEKGGVILTLENKNVTKTGEITTDFTINQSDNRIILSEIFKKIIKKDIKNR